MQCNARWKSVSTSQLWTLNSELHQLPRCWPEGESWESQAAVMWVEKNREIFLQQKDCQVPQTLHCTAAHCQNCISWHRYDIHFGFTGKYKYSPVRPVLSLSDKRKFLSHWSAKVSLDMTFVFVRNILWILLTLTAHYYVIFTKSIIIRNQITFRKELWQGSKSLRFYLSILK